MPQKKYGGIIIADDSDVFREAVRDNFLSVFQKYHLSAKIDEVDNGSDLVMRVISNYSNGNPYSLIVSDCVMPPKGGTVMDGPEAIRIIRERGIITPAYLISMHSAEDLERKTSGIAYTEFIPKQQIGRSIEEILKKVYGVGLPKSGAIQAA